jgi:hypothetical protein
VGPYGETYPASHDANQAVNIKAEEVSDAQEEADPLRITVHEVKAEPEVSRMFMYVYCWADIIYAEMPVAFLVSVCLPMHVKQLDCAADLTLKTFF